MPFRLIAEAAADYSFFKELFTSPLGLRHYASFGSGKQLILSLVTASVAALPKDVQSVRRAFRHAGRVRTHPASSSDRRSGFPGAFCPRSAVKASLGSAALPV
jgi:hypothetical protein